jgi:hypothetical protein
MGDGESATRWGAICARGRQRFIADCWNGDYFIQKMPDVDAYRYQHGLGLLTDQLLANCTPLCSIWAI